MEDKLCCRCCERNRCHLVAVVMRTLPCSGGLAGAAPALRILKHSSNIPQSFLGRVAPRQNAIIVQSCSAPSSSLLSAIALV